MVSYTIYSIAAIMLLGFIVEVIDASFGMGYGTVLTPLLLIAGFDPYQVVPAVLISQLVGDWLAVFFHQRFKNIDFFAEQKKALKIAILLGILSSIGAIISVLVSLSISKYFLSLYIGLMVTLIGIIILWTREKTYHFSWIKLSIIGFVAAFNKGLSGGGYGPLITGGQILSGINEKASIGITALAEGCICIIAFFTYFLSGTIIDWPLSIILSISVILSAPVAAFLVSKIENKKMKLIIGICTVILGSFTLIKLYT